MTGPLRVGQVPLEPDDQCRRQHDRGGHRHRRSQGLAPGRAGRGRGPYKEQFPLLANEFRTLRLIDLLTPLADKATKLSHLGELSIHDKPAVGIKAVVKDLPEMDLYFDKESCLPVRCEFRVKEPERSDESLHSYLFSDYKDFDGRKHFTKLTLKRDNKPFMEMERTDIKLADKIDDSMFAKP